MTFLGDAVDWLGTAVNAPELGISELFSGGKATANTGTKQYSGVVLKNGQPSSNLSAYNNAIVDKYGNLSNGINPSNTPLAGSVGGGNDSNANGSGITSIYDGNSFAAQNAGVINQLAQGAGVLQNSLNRLPGQLDIAKGNINTQFGQKNNELDSTFNQNQNSYNNQSTQNQQTLRTNKNAINDQSSSGLRGLQRLLGAYGAVGSDLGVAGQAVANRATQQNAGAGQTFAGNQSSLDTNFGNFKNQLDNERKKLADWKNSQLSNADQQSLTTRQDLLSKLADIQGQISAARGGSYASSAQPFLDQANALSGQIDNLGRLNPTYDGTTPVYNAPTLSSYNVANPASFGFGGNGTAASSGTPFLNLLLGKNDKTKQPVVG